MGSLEEFGTRGMGSLDRETHILTWKVILGQMVEEVWIEKVILGWMVEEVMDCIGRWNGEISGWMIDRMII